MDRVIARDVRFYVGGDRQRVNHIDTPDSEITFKHILLPVWWAAYKYRGKTYRFVVNARGSSSEGKPPIPHRKLLLTLFLGYALRVDGIDITRTACHEQIARRRLQIQRAAKVSAKSPVFEGLEEYMLHVEQASGVVHAQLFDSDIANK